MYRNIRRTRYLNVVGLLTTTLSWCLTDQATLAQPLTSSSIAVTSKFEDKDDSRHFLTILDNDYKHYHYHDWPQKDVLFGSFLQLSMNGYMRKLYGLDILHF